MRTTTVAKAGLPPLNLYWGLLELAFCLDSSLHPPVATAPYMLQGRKVQGGPAKMGLS